jgi:hypothetical protein
LPAHWLPLVQADPVGSRQSMSWVLAQEAPQGLQVAGQKPSAVALQGRRSVTHLKVQLATTPVRVRSLLLSSTHISDWVWQADGGSQVSPLSTAPLPQSGRQSSSLLALQADGQQPSPFAHVVRIPAFTHWAVQAAALPSRVRRRHLLAGQLAGQSPSHFSPQATSTTPLPQRHMQSPSFAVVQPDGQQASPLVQVEMVVSSTHRALHWAALPCSRRRWQPRGGQAVGQSPSHTSSPSTTPSPHRGRQSLSFSVWHPEGQQPSP